MQLAQLFGKTAKPWVPAPPQSDTDAQMTAMACQTDASNIATLLRFCTCYPNFFIDQSLFR